MNRSIPTIFSSEMVRAIQSGKKTITRRPESPRRRYAAGDTLWVKETFAPHPEHADALTMPEYDGGQNQHHLLYRADVRNKMIDGYDDDRIRWRPSIFLPRWASRLELEVTDARVERLHDITEEDAMAEGVKPSNAGYIGGFALKWLEIYGFETWEANPMVWRIAFRVVS